MSTRRHIRVVGAMLEKDSGRYLITQRRATAALPLLWEFPGGRVHDNESEETALARELKERLGIDITVDARAATTQHNYPDYDLDFSVFHCKLKAGSPEVSKEKINDYRWVQLSEMGNYKFPDADARTLARLLELDA